MMGTADGTIRIFRYTSVLCVLSIGFMTIVGSGDGTGFGPDWDCSESIYEGMYTSIAIDDLNSDGLLDIAVTYIILDNPRHQSYIAVILQDPLNPGSFQSPNHYTIGNDALSITIGDLNDDGLPDLAAANNSSNSISMLFQDSTVPGKFLASTNFPTGIYPQHVAIGDINGDGFGDLVIADKNTTIILQDPSMPGTFLPAISLGLISNCVAIGDLNDDNLPDLAITEVNYDDIVAVLLQDPINPGKFLPATYFDTGFHPGHVSVGYIDGDLLLDFAVANYGTYDGSVNASVSVFLQSPSTPGNFLPSNNYSTGRGSEEVAIEDLNGDNLADLAVVNSRSQRNKFCNPGIVSVLLQNPSADGTFYGPTVYEIFFQPLSIATGDLNGDSLPDIAVADDGANVLFQNPNSPGNFFAPIRVGG